jgi:hypothetical protein
MILGFNPYSYNHEYCDDHDTQQLCREIHCVQDIFWMCKVRTLPFRWRDGGSLCHSRSSQFPVVGPALSAIHCSSN